VNSEASVGRDPGTYVTRTIGGWNVWTSTPSRKRRLKLRQACPFPPKDRGRVSPTDLAVRWRSGPSGRRRSRVREDWPAPDPVALDAGSLERTVRLVAPGAIVDWEFACSGTPFFDVGNLLRPPVGLLPAFVDGFVDGYQGGGGSLPPDWKRLGELSDLFAWIEFLGRVECPRQVVDSARASILRTMGA